MEEIVCQLPERLLPWFAEHRRDLPWRQDREPYHIWVSEIMLQQTRVEAVRGYYARFLAALPTVADLANAPDDVLGKLWEGLGYYSRMRNLRVAAQMVQEKWGGRLPQDYDAIRSLPGIGEYTAGAIYWPGCWKTTVPLICLPSAGRPGNCWRRSTRKVTVVISPRRSWSWEQRCVCPTAHPSAPGAPWRICAGPGRRTAGKRFPPACPSGSGGRRTGLCSYWIAAAGLPWSSGVRQVFWRGSGSSPMCRASWRYRRPWIRRPNGELAPQISNAVPTGTTSLPTFSGIFAAAALPAKGRFLPSSG